MKAGFEKFKKRVPEGTRGHERSRRVKVVKVAKVEEAVEPIKEPLKLAQGSGGIPAGFTSFWPGGGRWEGPSRVAAGPNILGGHPWQYYDINNPNAPWVGLEGPRGSLGKYVDLGGGRQGRVIDVKQAGYGGYGVLQKGRYDRKGNLIRGSGGGGGGGGNIAGGPFAGWSPEQFNAWHSGAGPSQLGYPSFTGSTAGPGGEQLAFETTSYNVPGYGWVPRAQLAGAQASTNPLDYFNPFGNTSKGGSGTGDPTQRGVGMAVGTVSNLLLPGSGFITGPLSRYLTSLFQKAHPNATPQQVQRMVQAKMPPMPSGSVSLPTAPPTGGYGSAPSPTGQAIDPRSREWWSPDFGRTDLGPSGQGAGGYNLAGPGGYSIGQRGTGFGSGTVGNFATAIGFGGNLGGGGPVGSAALGGGGINRHYMEQLAKGQELAPQTKYSGFQSNFTPHQLAQAPMTGAPAGPPQIVNPAALYQATSAQQSRHIAQRQYQQKGTSDLEPGPLPPEKRRIGFKEAAGLYDPGPPTPQAELDAQQDAERELTQEEIDYIKSEPDDSKWPKALRDKIVAGGYAQGDAEVEQWSAKELAQFPPWLRDIILSTPKYPKATKPGDQADPKMVPVFQGPHGRYYDPNFSPEEDLQLMAKKGKTAVQYNRAGNTDTVPAMLTPREAVLNRNAAELAGRGAIEQLNAQGNQLAEQGVDLAGEKNMKPKKMQGGGNVNDPIRNPNQPPHPGWGREGTLIGFRPGTPDPNTYGPWQPPRSNVPGSGGGMPGLGPTPMVGAGVPGGIPGGPTGRPAPYPDWGAPAPGIPGGPTGRPAPYPDWGAPPPSMPKGRPAMRGGFYPQGQGLRAQGGTTDVQGVDPIADLGGAGTAYGAPVQLSAGDVSKFQKAAQQAGLNQNQIAGIMQALKGIGGAYGAASGGGGALYGSGGGEISPLTAAGGFQGGISDIGYPPFVAPTAEYHADNAGWRGPYDSRYFLTGY